MTKPKVNAGLPEGQVAVALGELDLLEEALIAVGQPCTCRSNGTSWQECERCLTIWAARDTLAKLFVRGGDKPREELLRSLPQGDGNHETQG